MRISDWSSDVCSSDLLPGKGVVRGEVAIARRAKGQRTLRNLHVAQQALYAPVARICRRQRGKPPPRQAGIAGGGIRLRPGDGKFDVQIRPLRFACDGRGRRRLSIGQETDRSEEHTSELQSLMRISYAVFCLKKKK